MTSYVLTGDSDEKNKFIEKLIRDESIPSYNIFDFQEILKIPQVREIKKLLSRKALGGKMRLFIVRAATLAAQNALLKTLEELPEDTTFIFLDDSNLIPTIISRCRLVNLAPKKINIDLDLLARLKRLTQTGNSLSSTLILIDELLSRSPGLPFDDLVINLRVILFGRIKGDDLKNSNLILRILKSLYKYYPLIENNNLNRRLLLERILISELKFRKST